MGRPAFPSVVIENVQPLLDGGRYPIKRIVGEDLVVEADIFKDGHDVVAAVLKWRVLGKPAWRETPMIFVDNDRWRGVCTLYDEDIHEYTVEAWTDTFRSWQQEFIKKFEGGISDLRSEALEGAAIVGAAAGRARDRADRERLLEFSEQISTSANSEIYAIAQSGELEVLMATYPDRSNAAQYDPAPRVVVDRSAALFGAWYEFFPRSAEGRGDRGSTFRDCLLRVDDAKAMGFDVVYFPPIHPIGHTNRKGRNNSVTCEPGDPGVPWAIGSEAGGHKTVEPALGTLADFDWLQKEVRKRGMEIALDFAINCSPDHPYVKEHPDWFYKRPDGTIKYAENPPKKYEDIYPLNFRCESWRELWPEMKSIVLFWAGRGVRIFRVDNPHTKPVAFWEYLTKGVRAKYPDVVFLSEAFTRPKMMKALAKAGFNQSYTYFTWRNSKRELIEYFTELTRTEVAEFFRPNLWPNTPDILHEYLQRGGRPAFMARLVLAATLGANYGVYGPAYELCENVPREAGSEEYLNSEKYEIKQRNLYDPSSLRPFISRVNAIRRENPALQSNAHLQFHAINNDQIICYSKRTADKRNVIVTFVNLDSLWTQSGYVELPVEDLGIDVRHPYRMVDLLTGVRFMWQGSRNYVELRPSEVPVHILRKE